MEKIKIVIGDCRESIKGLHDNSVDSIVTDPPYELGFMGKSWDASGIAYDVSLWKQCLRVLKPGGHLLAFSGSRTYHRMTCAIEDAGFEVRDQIQWVYGSGFPKSHNVGKAVARIQGVEIPKTKGFNVAGQGVGLNQNKELRSDHPNYVKPIYNNKWDGWGTALKPAHEPICVARKPLEGTVADNVMKWGVGGLNIDGCRVPNNGEKFGELPNRGGGRVFNTEGKTFSEAGYDYKEGDLNEEAVEKLKHLGRFPANLIHDGSQEVLELFPETGPSKAAARGDGNPNPMSWGKGRSDSEEVRGHDDLGGSAARFFYCPKASKKDRDDGCEGMDERRESDREKDDGLGGDNPRNRTNQPRRNFHPTVKPTDLMRYLCRLVTPNGGTVLDPFMGSGSTGRGAVSEGFCFVGFELSEDYAKIARARIGACIVKD